MRYAPFYIKLHQALEPKDNGKSDTYNEHDIGNEEQYEVRMKTILEADKKEESNVIS